MRVVVYGGGYWGVNYIRELGAHVVQVVESDVKRSEYIKQRFGVGVEPEFGGVEHDAVVICTPPDTHVSLALPHLEAGKLALIEKPLAHTLEDAERLAPYADQIMSGLVYLFHPAVYYEMPVWLGHHAIGHAIARRSNCGPVRPWADAMWDLAPHEISIFNYLFNPPKSVYALGTRDWATLHLNYKAAAAIVYVSWCGHHKVRTVELVSPADVDAGYTFDDMTWSMEVSPLRRMLDAFMERNFERVTYRVGMDVMSVLSAAEVSMSVCDEVRCETYECQSSQSCGDGCRCHKEHN